MFDLYNSEIPVITKENILKLNSYLLEIEIQFDNKVYQVDSIEEYFNLFNIGFQSNQLGIFHLFYKKNEDFKDYKTCFESISKYLTNNSHLLFDKNRNNHYVIRKNKLVKILKK